MREIYSSFRRLCLTFISFLLLLNSINSYGQAWSIIANENDISSVACSYTTIAVVDNTPYVAYVENSSPSVALVKKQNSNTNVWEQVGDTLGYTITYTRIYKDKANNLYVGYVDGANGNRLAVKKYNSATQTWDPLIPGNQYVSSGSVTYSISAFNLTPRFGIVFDASNKPYITYSERGTASNTYVSHWNGTSWDIVGGGPLSTDIALGTNIALDNAGNPFVVYMTQGTITSTTGPLSVYKFNSGTNAWDNISPSSPINGGSATTGAVTNVRHPGIAIDANNLMLVSYFNTSNSNRSSISQYDISGNTWTYLGTNGTRDASNNSLLVDAANNFYNTFADALVNGGLSNMLRVYKRLANTTTFYELLSPGTTRGIDSTGPSGTGARSIVISEFNLAVGSNYDKPYIVYTKTNSNSIRTPLVQVFEQKIVTTNASNITASSAQTGGVIHSDDGSPITERGVVYSSSVNPTTADTKVVSGGTALGSYTAQLVSLQASTTYHVRAYYINGNGTEYGNDIVFTTQPNDPSDVVVQDLGSSVVLKNDIITATISKSSATVTSLLYEGLEMVNGGYNGGQLYWSWNMPNYQNPSGCTYSLVADPNNNSNDFAEVKFHMTWNGSGSTAAMDVDIYYSLPRHTSGLYASATLSHPAAYPDMPGGEWRMAGYPNPRLNWMTVDSLRNRLMPDQSATQVAVAGAPQEVTRWTSGLYNNQYECKYDYSADFGYQDAWGWSSTADNVGLWMTAPSKEYYPGGPMKRELMCHYTPVILNMLGGTHYGMGSNTSVAAGEEWSKTFGPYLIYCNSVPNGTPDAPTQLWKNAVAQNKLEQAKWPYNWYTNPNYVQNAGRGNVTGILQIKDPGQPDKLAVNTWVGLAIPPVGGSVNNFQQWVKNYQYWAQTDANGHFTIPNVIAGTYNLYAFGPDAIGQLSIENAAVVSAGATLNLDTIAWVPARTANTIWELGTNDRNAMEFKHGYDWWTSNIYPNPNWGKFMDYTSEFPGDVNFVIGQSDVATDWNFVQPYDKSVQASSPKWNVKFNLAGTPTPATTAAVYVSLATNFSAAVILTVNGTNVTNPSTGLVPSNSSNAMIRKGIHGAWSELRFTFPASYLVAGENNISFSLRITGGANSGEVMYDYVRLEADVPGQALPLSLTAIKAIPESGNVHVYWDVQNEEDVLRYEVERSLDARNFSKITQQNAKGNFAGVQNYNALDKQPFNGDNYYRIKIISKSGIVQYSSIVKVTLNGGTKNLSVFPTPLQNSQLFMQMDNFPAGNYQWQIVSTSGSKLTSGFIDHQGGSAVKTLNLQSMASGVYYLNLQGSGTQMTYPVLKQ